MTLRIRGQCKTLQATENFDIPTTDSVYIPAQREVELMLEALRKAYPDEPIHHLMSKISPATLAQVPGLPVTLGAGAYDDPINESFSQCLVTQLHALKAAHPFRQHFRLLLINAFGSNLGDLLVGLTAFRQVLLHLRAELPLVSVDVMLGWHTDDRLERLFRDIDGIDTILTQGLSVAELSRYQAVFDTSKLLNLPRYGQMPVVDWYLWWMGVDPATVAMAEKRNRVAIPEDAIQMLAALLPPSSGLRIFVNPHASVPLRSMPVAAARRLIEHLLSTWPQAEVVVAHALDFTHPRLLNLSGAIPTVDHLAALLARMDGLIGVDTYTQHLADATATPAVSIHTSVPTELYPYYPLGNGVLLPDAEHLPAWGKAKVSMQLWAEMEERYAAAWQSLDLDAVLKALHRVMARKAESRQDYAPRLLSSASTPGKSSFTRLIATEAGAIEVPLRQRDDPMASFLNQTIADLGAKILGRGDTVVHLGAGAGEATLTLARMISHHGRLLAFEPRRELHQLLCANLVRAGIRHVETWPVMPEGETFSVRDIHRLRVDDEFQPLSMANCLQAEPVVCWPLDTLDLKACRLLVVSSPLPLLSVLKGSVDTLKRLRPVVLAGVLRSRDSEVMERFFAESGYQTRILALADTSDKNNVPQFRILLAETPGD